MLRIISNCIIVILVSGLFTYVLSDEIADPGIPDSIIIGNLDLMHSQADIGDTINIPIWVKCDNDITSFSIHFAIKTELIDTVLPGKFYDVLSPFKKDPWDYVQFMESETESPKPDYSQITLLAQCTKIDQGLCPMMNTQGGWHKIAEFEFIISSDESIKFSVTRIIPIVENNQTGALFKNGDGGYWKPVLKTLNIHVAPDSYEPPVGSNYFSKTGVRKPSKPYRLVDKKESHNDNNEIVKKAWDYLENNKDKYCLSDPKSELSFRSMRDRYGRLTLLFDQIVDDIPVEFGNLSLTYNENGSFIENRNNLNIFSDSVETSSVMSEDEALEIIQNYLRKRESSIKSVVISVLEIRHYDNSFKPAWIFSLSETNHPPVTNSENIHDTVSHQFSQDLWILDANTGEFWVIDSQWIDERKRNTFGGYKTVVNAYNYAVEHKDELGLDDPYEQLIPCQVNKGRRGQVRFNLNWKGLEVVNETFRFGVNNCDQISSVSNVFNPLIKLVPTKPKIDKKEIEQIAFSHCKENLDNLSDQVQPNIDKIELCIIKYGDEYKLVWSMVVYPNKNMFGYFCKIDAISGKVLGFTSTIRR